MPEEVAVEVAIKDAPAKDVTAARRGPLSALPRFEHELERFFGAHRPWRFDWPFPRSELNVEVPNVDVIDREEDIVVKAELPGFKKEDIDVSLSDARMTIKASSKSETTEEDGDYYRREISRGYVSRTVALPSEVVTDKAKARLEDGVLEVTVPKATKSKRHSVEIES
jgi:HSP20 family protein